MRQAKIHWQNGQPRNIQFNDIYFSHAQGLAETEYVFLNQNHLARRWRTKPHFVIAESGFGTGLNFLATVALWLKHSNKQATLHYFSVEKFPLSPSDLKHALSRFPELNGVLSEFILHYPPAVTGFHHIPLFGYRVFLMLMLGDVEDMLSKMSATVDAWYLDGFAPEKNPQMWTPNVFRHIARLSHEGTTFSTFTAAGHIRRGLSAVGFEVNKIKGHGPKREMLRGVLRKTTHPQSKTPWFEAPPPQNHAKHAIVVGAGIAGVTTAWALAKRGFQVDLMDQQTSIAREGSGMPLGILLPRLSLKNSTESVFYTVAYFYAIRQLTALKREQGDFIFKQTGVLQLPNSARVQRQIEACHFDEALVHAVSAKQASARAGIEIASEALYFPMAGVVDSRDLCERLIQDADDRITLRLNTPVHRLEFEKGCWQLLDQCGGLLARSECVVLANAARTSQFPQTAWLPLSVARGQITRLPVTPQSQNLQCAICDDGYVLPEINGAHIIGATFQKGDDDTGVRPEDHIENQQRLARQLPGIFDPVTPDRKGHAALRALTPDRMPLAGPVPDADFFYSRYHDLRHGKPAASYPAAKYLPGLYLNTGHGAKGLCSSFLSAELIASQLCDEPGPVPEDVRQALHPARFIIRDLKRGMKPEFRKTPHT
ncbi:MAG: bifunctional tRNA (5-methylaminomethyl-2-thiouridine)(34)-methyltransferase MnmD/FAD-dependent 5-carboxymethylaminomethyl-2-thiouridine(34) oxidoreductase MnmC [Nitrospiria bacterium]